MLHRRAIAAFALVAGSLLPSRSASAEPTATERVVAREQFQEGIALEARGDWEGALARFTDVARVVSTPNVHYHLGLCLERTGRLVRALDAFERSVALRSASPDPPLERDAEERIAALRRRIPTVALRMPPDAPREPPPAVFVDGVAIAVGPRPIPLDPGPHRFVVQAAGRAAFEAERNLRERESVVLDVLFDGSPTAGASTPSRGDARAPNADAGSPLRTGGWIAVGAAGLALATGVTMHLLRSATIDELDAACGAARSACPPSKEDLVDRGRTYTTLGNVFLGVGAAAAAAGVTMLLLDHRASPRAPSARRDGFTVQAVASPLAFTVHGTF